MKCIALALSLLFSSQGFSQTVNKDSTRRSELANIQLRQSNFNKMAMWSLNSWAVGNITYGSIAHFQTNGEARYFHQMNAIWNVVNLGIGIPGIIGAYKNHPAQSFEEIYKTQRRYEAIYLFNAGLDVGYIAGGFALREYGKRLEGTNGLRFRGYGSALIFQGGYLFLHDLALFFLLKSNTPLLDKEWDHLHLSYTGTSIRLNVK